MAKPIVHYVPDQHGPSIELGKSATIFDVQDHPRLGFKFMVHTSKVVGIMENGEFETENTIYRPVD